MIQLSEISTSGRLGRKGFWVRNLIIVPVGLWIVISAGQSPGAPYDAPLALVLVALLVSIWGRRLHDRGRSAWWLLGVFVPVIGAATLILECGIRGTSRGASRYGPESGLRSGYVTVANAPAYSKSPQ
jgi:uncharacterized membrane protein YhaH (DUF805 family)